ncbi:MAG TPA: hypothetical protein VHD90_20700 [Phototrophicaceae bacterium]|nr:hypothetical protein [Phototrophicaceae bacterium]
MGLNAPFLTSDRLMIDQQLFGEIFPILTEALPALTAYRLKMQGVESPSRVGTKLAERLAEAFGGSWVWSMGKLITDAPPNPVNLIMAIDEARGHKAFQHLETIEEDFQWQPTAEELAGYVVRGPVAQFEDTILEALSRTVYTIKGSRIQREYHLRTWAVNDAPALSVTVVSRLLYEPDLQAYLEKLTTPSEVIGLWVADKTSQLQGEVIKLVGLLDEQRERLLELTQRSTTRQIVENADGKHWVVRVLSGAREYDYVADALDLVIRPEDIQQFAINQQQIEKALHLKPALHAQMVKLVSDILKEARLIGAAYSTQNAPQLYQSGAPQANLLFGKSKIRPHNALKLAADFKENGVYQVPDKLKQEPLRVVVINTLADEVSDFLEALKRAMSKDYNLALEVVRERNMRVISQTNLESAVRLLQKETSDLVLVFLPDETESDEEETVSDRTTRVQTIGRGLPCLIVNEASMNRPEDMPQIVMGLIARARAIPFLLADPLPYADRVIGLHLVYHSKREGEVVTGISRIYGSDGQFLRAVIASAPSSEGLPDDLLNQLFPRDLLKDKRIIVHGDGKLKRNTLRSIGAWEDELNATILPVEVIRAGVPRLYAFNAGKIEPPHWGSVFRLNENEAFVQSTETTIQPLHVRCEPPLTIEQATHSVLLFTLLHYGALKSPKLPVTIHNAEAIETGILRGIIPTDLVTEVPFWL